MEESEIDWGRREERRAKRKEGGKRRKSSEEVVHRMRSAHTIHNSIDGDRGFSNVCCYHNLCKQQTNNKQQTITNQTNKTNKQTSIPEHYKRAEELLTFLVFGGVLWNTFNWNASENVDWNRSQPHSQGHMQGPPHENLGTRLLFMVKNTPAQCTASLHTVAE